MRAQVLFHRPPIAIPIEPLFQRLFDRISQCPVTLMFEDDSKRTCRLEKSAALCNNRPAAACDPFQSDKAERFLPTRRYDDHTMSIQLKDKVVPCLRAKKFHLISKSKLFDQFGESVQIRPVANDREGRKEIALFEALERVEKNINTFIRNQAANEDEVSLSLGRTVSSKQFIPIRVTDNRGRDTQMIGN